MKEIELNEQERKTIEQKLGINHKCPRCGHYKQFNACPYHMVSRNSVDAKEFLLIQCPCCGKTDLFDLEYLLKEKNQ